MPIAVEHEIKPFEVTFSGVSYHEVKDDLGAGYAAPHWQDNSSPPNGTGTDAGDHRFPISFTAGSKISLSAKLRITPTPANGTDIRVRALGPGFDFPAQVATISNGQLLYPLAEATATLGTGVGFLNPMVLNWQVSTDGGSTWRSVGQTGNRVYITLSDPLATTLYETILDIGARNAAGAATAASAVTAIWADFLGPIPGVQRKVRDGFNQNDSVAMRYWLDTSDTNLAAVSGTCQLLSAMLDPTREAAFNGVGTCVAWSMLFDAVLKAQGISGSERYQVRANTAIYPNASLMLVKNWTFSGTGTAPAECAPFNYLASEIADAPGAPGQGIGNPPPAFFNHFIVKYDGKWYDPSYGSGPYANDSAWENASLDGLTAVCETSGGGQINVAKKNNTSTVETSFEAQ
ncbi:MAG: hypothetical protein AAB091_03100 [Elusimicrobiota bacterium]